MDFNSFHVRGEGGSFVVDPLEPDDAVLHYCRDAGVDAIVITNRDHERAAARFAAEFSAPVFAHECDAAEIAVPIARRLVANDDVFGWRVVELQGFKTPGEFVLHRRALRAAISGDAFWGVPAGALTLMNDRKLADPVAAVLSARRVRALDLDVLFVGDGAPVFRDASSVLGAALDARDGIAVNRINLDELDFRTSRQDRPPFTAAHAEIGLRLGAVKLGYAATLLRPGESFCPLHWHTAEEELFIVWDGNPTLRTPRGTFVLRRGDCVAFPVGAGGAHRLSNDSDAPATIVLIANTNHDDVCFYPDSSKLAVEATGMILRSAPELDYYDGE